MQESRRMVGSWKLEELINFEALQTMFENLNKVVGIPVGIMDMDGNALASAGWNGICSSYHRKHPETAKRCKISDQCIKMHIGYDDFVAYKCLNHMWDAAVPLIIEKEHLATLFIGPYFHEDELINLDLYKKQAAEFGFDEEQYLSALQEVPRISKEKIRSLLEYYKAFVMTVVDSSLSKLMYMEASSKLNRLFDSMQDHIILLDRSGRFLEWNRPISQEVCLYPEEFIGNYYYDVLPYELCALLERGLKRLETEDVIAPHIFPYRVNELEVWYSAQITKVMHFLSGKADCYMIALRDVTERKKTEDEIRFLNYYDKLTGVYNRRYYENEIKRFDCEENLPISIIIGDVNGLRMVNDAFGHDKGDELLQKAAAAIQAACREQDLVARWGGDEFVILLPNTKGEDAERLIQKIRQLYSEEYVNSVNINISFGWETKYSADEDIMKVLKSAEDYMYKHKLLESQSLRGNIIGTIINTLHEKNYREEQHSKRVSELCQKIGKVMGLSEIDIHKLKVVGLLHDIGKIAIGEGILNKPGRLSDLEFIEIKRHPDIGYRILSASDEMLDLAECIWAHHERWDGGGYPKGLSGTEIPQLSRIIAVADSYDAMTSERPYRKALSDHEAILEIRNHAGTQFDPDVARIFTEDVLNNRWE
ncbi:diguanylate cyclase [Anoxybacterium hadale]|uniref:Diguanylate cyclase n=1 Tax=Anoxybacterium hadale TaxID=3408580 RepID=A0ACD1AFJ1_9FIRM|nr:diguanylate cyclase [Clostridiales bacterium]